MHYQGIRLPAACLAAALALGACAAPPLEAPARTDVQESPDTVAIQQRDQVDLLFLIDDSRSMGPMQGALRERFGELLRVFDELAANGRPIDLHIGVVTSDLGAGQGGICERSGAGRGGVLQALGAAADPDCQPPTGGKPYIEYKLGPAGVNNLPPGQDLARTFTCMASVGASGCGAEHQLEAVYAALHNKVENAGFLRDDAILAVAFLTNEDDGSAPPTVEFYGNSVDAEMRYGYAPFRQTRHGVYCGDPLAEIPYGVATGPLSGCRPAPNPGQGPDLAYDVARYVDLFTRPADKGGIKRDPRDVVLFGIDAPDDAPGAFEVVLARDPNAVDIETCQSYSRDPQAPCVPGLKHSCRSARGFFGDPAVRLNSVIRAAAHHGLSSICDEDYSPALQKLAEMIGVAAGRVACLAAPIADPDNPDCAVTLRSDGSAGAVGRVLQRCDRTGGQTPCWRLDRAACGEGSPDGAGIVIELGPEQPPPRTTAQVACATKIE